MEMHGGPDRQRQIGFVGVIGIGLLTLLLSALAIDGRSLWTDEIGTWELTQWSDWTQWAQAFWNHYNSDGQLPVYHAYMRAWVQLAGDGELALRLSNMPWLALALLGLARVEVPSLGRGWLLVAAGVNAFVWYYLNDARPYMMYMAGACWMCAAMVRMLVSGTSPSRMDLALRESLIGAFLLIAGTILGVFWIFSCLLALLLMYPAVLRELLRSIGRQKWLFALGFVLCALAAGVAIHSHLSGVRANQTAAFSLGGMAYGLIELLGAAGLGPSRNALRVNVMEANRLQLALMLLLAGAAALAVLQSWWRLPSWRLRWTVLLAAGLPLGVMALLGLGLHWRVVGRHLSAILPVLLLGLAAFFSAAAGRSWVRRAAAAVLGLALLVSALEVRWASRHMKDDYEQAATWAREALGRGQSVLWLADQRGLRYYGLVHDRSNFRIQAVPGLIPFALYPAAAAQMPWPDVVIYSPREGVDPGRLARPVLESGRYALTDHASAFERHRLTTGAPLR